LESNPTIFDDNNTIEIEGQAVRDEAVITTNSRDDSKVQFDDHSDSDFDKNVDGDEVED